MEQWTNTGSYPHRHRIALTQALTRGCVCGGGRQVEQLLARHPAVFMLPDHCPRWLFRGAQYHFKSPPASVALDQ